MRNLNKLFINRKIDYQKLLDYGFKLKDDNYYYEKTISNKFNVIIELAKEKQASKVIDTKENEEYILVDVETASGEYVGKIRDEYNEVIADIIDKCTSINVFKEKQSLEIIKYIKEKYNDDLEYLWKKLPTAAVWRNKENNKWYGLVMTIPANKIGIESDAIIEAINLSYQKDEIETIIDNKTIFPGYHMNKKSWITVPLDGRNKAEKLFKLIDNSYNISLNK